MLAGGFLVGNARWTVLGLDPKQAAIQVGKYHPMYEGTHEIRPTSGDDRPLPPELMDRVNLYIEKRWHEESDGFEDEIERCSSLNAILRREIRAGSV